MHHVPLKAKILGYLIRMFLWLLIKTCKFEVMGVENLQRGCQEKACMIMLWHNRLGLIAQAILASNVLQSNKDKHFTAFISKSRDGDILAAYTLSFSQGNVIRVPHNSKDQALKELILRLKTGKEIILITPDGPRGPKYVVKPGIALAAKETNATLIPFTWTASSSFQLKSWDGFYIPKPFSRIKATFGDGCTIDKDKDMAENLAHIKRCLEGVGL